MSRSGRRRWGLSARLTMSFAAGALLLSAVLAGCAYALAWRFLLHQQDDTALHQAYVNAAMVRDGLRSTDPDVPALLDSVTLATTSKSVVVHGRRWFTSSLVVGRDALPASLRDTTLQGTPGRVWTTVGGSPALVVGIPLPEVHAAYFDVVDAQGLQGTLNTLRTVLLVTAAATTAAGGGTGWWASRRLLAPMRAVTAAASRITTGDLRARLSPSADPQLAELVDAFNRMVDALQSRIERDARFAGDVSHELRSPLTTVATSLSVLQSRRAELSERAAQALDLLASEVARFQQLVEDLLEMARSDADMDPPPQEPLRIAELVRHLTGRSGYADVAVEVEGQAGSTQVAGDKRRLEQALRNLLDNAKVHGGGKDVTVRVRTVGDSLRLHVEDSGPGVPADQRERVFERFARGPVASRRGGRRGTGLGLALVREHVEAHRGRVWVEDRPGGGARFVIELPVVSA